MAKQVWTNLSKTEAIAHQNYKFGGWMIVVLVFLGFGLLGAIKGLLDHHDALLGRGLLAFEKIPLSLILFLVGQLVISGLLFISALFKMPVFPKLAVLSAIASFAVLVLTLFSGVMMNLMLSGMRCCGSVYRAVEDGNGLTYLAIYSFLLSVVIAGYALLGSRPNLIYRHRVQQ